MPFIFMICGPRRIWTSTATISEIRNILTVSFMVVGGLSPAGRGCPEVVVSRGRPVGDASPGEHTSQRGPAGSERRISEGSAAGEKTPAVATRGAILRPSIADV
jgi:hypothetical protein